MRAICKRTLERCGGGVRTCLLVVGSGGRVGGVGEIGPVDDALVLLLQGPR